jgi:hypothetical protein
MVKKLIAIFLILVIFIIFSCEEKDPFTELTKILLLQRECKYLNTLEALDSFEIIFPDYDYNGYNVNVLRYNTYERIGDFKNAEIELDKAMDRRKSNIFIEVYNFDIFDLYLLGTYIKNYKINEVEYFFSKYLNFEKIILDSDVKQYFNNNFEDYETFKNLIINYYKLEAQIYALIVDTIFFRNESINDEQYFESCKRLFTLLLFLNNSESIEYALITLLDFKMIDGKYYSDYLWSNEITKQYFQEMVNKGLITAETLETIKEKVYREDIPQDFLDLFEMVE